MARVHPSPSPPPPPLPFASTASPPQPSPLSPLHADLLAKLHLEQAIADGAENLLAVFQAEEQQQLQEGSEASNKHDLKLQVERELQGARSRIAEMEERIQQLLVQEQPLASPSLNGTSNDVHSPNSMASSEYYHYAASSGGASPSTSAKPLSPLPSYPLTPTASIPPSPSHSPSAEADTEPDQFSFGPTFELVLSLVQRLDELESEAGPSADPQMLALERLKAMDSIVEAVGRQVRVKYELVLSDVLSSIMPLLAEDSSTTVRAGAYRLLRHLVVDQHDVYALHSRYIDLFLVRSLSRDHHSPLEKEQALRLVRLLLSLPGADIEAIRPVPCSVIRAVVAIAESPDEKLRLIALETLGELLIRDLPLLSHSSGLRVVLQALSDGPHDLSPFLAQCFLWVMDRPGYRKWLRPGVDVEIVLAAFTEVNGRGQSQEERVRAAAKITTTFLKSWSGIMYFNLNGKRALRSLVDSLTNPSQVIRDTLLDMFFNIFNVKTPAWYASSMAGSRLSGSNRRSAGAVNHRDALDDPVPAHEKINLIDQYLSILLLIFIDAGLVEALVSVAADSKDATTSKKVSLLMGEILQLANRVLPLSYAAHAQTLPRLFALTTSFDTSQARLAASSTLSAVDTLNRNQSRGRLEEGVSEDPRPRSNSLDDPLKRGQRQVESTKMLAGMQIDDSHFRNRLLATQVLSTKDHTAWNVDIIIELLEGPLLNPKRLDEAMRASKFMRRLLGFFHPFAYRYTEVKRTKATAKFTQLGCTLVNTLVASPDGVRYLTEDKMLRQIADCLVQLDPLGGPPASEIVLSKQRMENTLASGYFEILGTLTKSVEGVKLLDQFKVFTSFYRISELRSREDLVKAIIENVDYTMDGHPRVFLSKALTSSYKHIRIFATQHLSQLLTTSANSSTTACAQEWEIRLLLTQIYDPSPEVCELAVKVLETVCRSLDTLEIVVQMRPSLDHLGEMGTGLLTRFLSTSVGVRYLHEIGFIQRELDEWYDERNAIYVVQLELQLASALHTDQISSDTAKSPFNGTPPSHFYGELVKTDEGCEMLEDSGHFPEFADFIRQHAMEEGDLDIIAKLKSVLWAVGQVGATAGGLDFIDQEYILESIVDIAEESPVYSLRGTAYFVLGLISSTLEGVEMLEEYGWEGVTTPLGSATGLCVPMELENFVYTPTWDPPAPPIPEALLLAAPKSHLEVEALSALANLSNHILATKASKALARLKQRHRELFSSPRLYYRALEMLANHHYRLAVRRYIIELFDLPLDEEVAASVMDAGEDLRVEGEKEREEAGENGEDGEMGWRRNGGGVLDKAVKVILEGVEGGFSDEDDDEVGSPDEGAAVIPLQVMQPLLSIKGFLLH